MAREQNLVGIQIIFFSDYEPKEASDEGSEVTFVIQLSHIVPTPFKAALDYSCPPKVSS